MGLEGIKLIACDLDGTLLHPGEREPRSEAFELIDELHRRGIVFMPASGRQYASLRYLFTPVADELAYVCENGALVMSEGRAVVKRSMERSLAMDIANAVAAYPHADVTLSCEGHLYTMSGNDAFVDHLRYEVHCDVAVVVPRTSTRTSLRLPSRRPRWISRRRWSILSASLATVST